MRHPLAKFALLCAYAAAAVAASGLAVKGGLVLAAVALGRRRLLSRRAFHAALAFGGFVFLVQALLAPGEPVAGLGPFTLTQDGLRAGAEMALRFLGVLAGSLLFLATTPPDVFAAALSQTRLPYRYTYVLVMTLRFLPLFQTEYQRVRDAQRARGLLLRPWNLLAHVRWTALPVLAAALARADAVALSMQARGFGRYPRRTSLDAIPWEPADVGLLILATVGFATAGWFAAGGGRWP